MRGTPLKVSDPRNHRLRDSGLQRSLENAIVVDPPIVRSLCGWNEIVCSALQIRSARESGDSGRERQAIADLKPARAESIVGRCELARAYEWTGQLKPARREMELRSRALEKMPEQTVLGLNALQSFEKQPEQR